MTRQNLLLRLTAAASVALVCGSAAPVAAAQNSEMSPAQQRQQAVDTIRAQLGEHYDVSIDEQRKLIKAIGLPGCRAEDLDWDIDATWSWWQNQFGSEFGPAGQTDADWVGIIVTPPEEFAKFAGPAAEVGHGQFHSVGGYFDRQRNRVIVNRMGPNLRHELAHVLHERAMRAAGLTEDSRRHATWIQEGLATMAEDLDPVENGSGFAPAQGWRMNVAHRLAKGGGLLPMSELSAMDNTAFSANRPLARYAQARGVMEYLANRGELGTFWTLLNESGDPTGMSALQATCDLTEENFDKYVRGWLMGVEPQPEEIAEGQASLGLRLAAAPRGLIVMGMNDMSSPARRGDVLVALNGRPVRELPELIRLLSAWEPGQEVELTLRRGETDRVETVALVEK